MDIVALHRKPPVGLKTLNGHPRESAPSVAVIYESAACRQLIMERFEDICIDVLAQRFVRNTHLQHTLLTILPRLAAFDREKFTH